MRWIGIFMSCVILLASMTNASACNDEFAKINVEKMKLNVEINNGYAVTSVVTSVKNENKELMHYSFFVEIPNGAFITNFSIKYEGITYHANILEKEVADEKYNDAVKHGKTAGIVAYRDNKIFECRINVPSNKEVEVKIVYEQYIRKILGNYEYKFMLYRYNLFLIKDFEANIKIESTYGLGNVSFSSHDLHADVKSLDSTMHIIHTSKKEFSPTDNITCVWTVPYTSTNGHIIFYKDYFMHIFNPGMRRCVMPKDIIFVADVSGSMSGFKIEQMKEAFIDILHQLRADDNFNIIKFSSLYKIYSDGILPVTEYNIENASSYVDDMVAQGGTNIYDSLRIALSLLTNQKGRISIIVFLTDGQPTVGITDKNEIREEIKKRNDVDAYIFSLGFGNDVDFDFLTALSMENYGTAQKIYVEKDASEQIKHFYETISSPILKVRYMNYKNAKDLAPSVITYLFEGSEIVVTGRVTHETLKFKMLAEDSDECRNYSASFSVKDAKQKSFVERFWAYMKIQDLFKMLTCEPNRHIEQEIINLSLKYHFVTEYTSLYVEVPNITVPVVSSRSCMSEERYYDYSTNYKTPSTPINPIFPTKSTQSTEYGETQQREVPGFDAFILMISLVCISCFLRKRRLRKSNY